MKKRKKIDYEQPELTDFLDLLGKTVAYGATMQHGGSTGGLTQDEYDALKNWMEGQSQTTGGASEGKQVY